MIQKDPEAAQKVWQIMLSADVQIVPNEAKSYFRIEAEKELQKAYRNKGRAEMNMERYPEAFEWVMKGMKVGQGSQDLKSLVMELESQAALEFRKSVSCQEFQKILAMTRAEPPSPVHKQALGELERRGCR